ncbi:hypothetical protein FOA52_001135 [Chlamydomonas sp. UWO 241]|nr:hypothetical protein FOA52_001135 [Chlamydomonas sp. UWO 241]
MAAAVRSGCGVGLRCTRRPPSALAARAPSRVAPRSRCPAVSPVAATKQKFGSFEELLAGSDVPVLVDFYATWCGPCQMLSPILANVQKTMAGKIQVVKIDTEKYPALSSKYNVKALPTLVLFKGGQPVDRIEGMPQEVQLVDRLQYFLKE